MSEVVAFVLIMEWHSIPKSDALSIYQESNTFLRQILVINLANFISSFYCFLWDTVGRSRKFHFLSVPSAQVVIPGSWN